MLTNNGSCHGKNNNYSSKKDNNITGNSYRKNNRKISRAMINKNTEKGEEDTSKRVN